MAINNKKINKRTTLIVSAILIAVICLISVGSIAIFAGGRNNDGLLLSCDFNGNTTDAVSRGSGQTAGINYYNDALRVNNEHKAGNSFSDASSYVKYNPIKQLENSDFTIAFDYYANEPTDCFSTIISTGKYGKGLNIFNKNGIGVSFGNYVMRSDALSETDLNRGSVRLDHNLLNDGNSHSVLLTVKRSQDMKLYIDGFFIAKVTLAQSQTDIESTTFIIGADSSLKYGTEDMTIDNLRVYNKVCDKFGQPLFDEYKWLVAEKKGYQVANDYKGLASDESINALKTYLSSNKPMDKDSVPLAVTGAENAIKNVINSAKSKERVNFQILSDTHMHKTSMGPTNQLIDALNNINEWFSDNSALVVTGDLTDNGLDCQYEKYYMALNTANKSPYTMNITGNHESSYNDTSMEEDNARFLKYENEYRKSKGLTELSTVYYDNWVKGYHFIGLGSEETLSDGGWASISPEQMQFLRDKLKETTTDANYTADQPIFVFCHQPLNNTTYNSDIYGIGPNSDELKSIFREYPQVIYVSGHAHNGYVGAEAVYNEGYGTLVDMPCLRANEVVRYKYSIGYNVAVYDDNRVIFTPVNFTDDDIMYDMSIVIDRNSRETITDQYDVKNISITYDGKDVAKSKLTDNYEHTYVRCEQNKEFIYTFVGLTEIDGLRLGTRKFSSLTEIKVSFSSDGVNYTEETYPIKKAMNLQKIFFEKKSVLKMKISFNGNDTITTLVPTKAK